MMKRYGNRARIISRLPRPAVLIGLLILMLVFIGLISACSRLPETPTPVETVTPGVMTIIAPLFQSSTPTTISSTLTSAEAGPKLAVQATQPLLLPAGLTSTPTGQAPTHTPCPRPSGWITYEILPGDTLFWLANATNTTIEAIMQANCMENESITAYEPIYLPQRPPAPPPAPPAPPAGPPAPIPTHQPGEPPTNSCDVPFACATPGPSLVLATGGGNEDPTFEPCKLHEPAPWINFNDTDQFLGFSVQVGQRAYFHACDFPYDVVSVEIVYPGQSTPQPVKFSTVHPNPDLQMGKSAAVIDWPALPTKPLGKYQLIIKDKDNNLATLDFTVYLPDPNMAPPNKPPFILVVPASDAPGTSFQVYYVGFPYKETPTFRLFGQDYAVPKESHTLSLRSQWPVLINQPLDAAWPGGIGWAFSDLKMDTKLPPGNYAVTSEDQSVSYSFWLLGGNP